MIGVDATGIAQNDGLGNVSVEIAQIERSDRGHTAFGQARRGNVVVPTGRWKFDDRFPVSLPLTRDPVLQGGALDAAAGSLHPGVHLSVDVRLRVGLTKWILIFDVGIAEVRHAEAIFDDRPE
jgi:hypothetical protein